MNLKKKNALAYDRGLFRYVILEPLLTRPPAPGELAARLREMSSKSYIQQWDHRSINVSVRTLERWYAECKKAALPTQALQPKLRSDRKQTRVVLETHKKWLAEFNRKYPSWSVQLLYDNMDAANLATFIPSYSTILRYFKAQNFFTKSLRSKHRNVKEIRSYEVEYVGQLWHMDFHMGSRMVLTESGEFKQPICMDWKATAKKNSLMINQFQDEKSQSVYMVIDKGRVMKMPFNGLSLLDYAINATLVLSNVILKKHDKAGMFAFSKKVENRVVAEKRGSQMQQILETLYNIKTDYFESDFSRLYVDIKKNINQRSLLILYTNFETLDGLHRQLKYLKAIAKNHLLVVVFFNNTELNDLILKKSETIQEVYDKVIAEKFAFEKRLIVNELKKYGIHTLLTQPENLSLDSINKYLEIKARSLL